MADVEAVLRCCDPVLLESGSDPEQSERAEAGALLYLTDSRRVQKVLRRQLFVLDSMMSLLEGLQSAPHLMTQPCPAPPGGGARGRWKALKLESRSGVEETETLIGALQEKIHQVQLRRHTLTDLVQQLHTKKQQCEQVDESLQEAHHALQSCDSQLTRLRAESQVALDQLISWQRLRDELQVNVSAEQEVMQIHLLSFSQSELCVELRPHPTHDQSNQLEPLKLSITWTHDDRFRLQVNEGTAGLVEDCRSGRRCELSAALLEVMQCYVGQFELLSEIQGLRSSFAIDWRPAQRVLVYLKSALLVCHLEVEEGYPRAGGARLLSVRRDGQPVDISGLKPHRPVSRLTDWLLFLSDCPLL